MSLPFGNRLQAAPQRAPWNLNFQTPQAQGLSQAKGGRNRLPAAGPERGRGLPLAIPVRPVAKAHAPVLS